MGVFKLYAEFHGAAKSYDFDQGEYEKRINSLGFFESPKGRCAALTCLWLSRYKRKQLGNAREIKYAAHSFRTLTSNSVPATESVLTARSECAAMVNEKQRLNDSKRKEIRKLGARQTQMKSETPEYQLLNKKIVDAGYSGGCSFSFLKQTMSELCPGVGTGQLTWEDEKQNSLRSHERDKLSEKVLQCNGRYYFVTLNHAHGIIIDHAFSPNPDNDGTFKFFDPNWGSATFNQAKLFKTFLDNYLDKRVFWNSPFPDEDDLSISYVMCDL